MATGKNIWIIGASCGIGEALAKELASRGAKIAVSARSENKLSELISQLKGEGHLSLPLSVTESQTIRDAANKIKESWGQIDSIIFMAAIYNPLKFGEADLKISVDIINTNFIGAVNTIDAVLPILKTQRSGQIAICGSVAGYRGLPNSQPYSATKAALISLTESLKIELLKYNIDVKLISPGFVKTRMTDKNPFPMPFIIQPHQAAFEIAKGLESNAFEIHFPKRLTYLMKLLRILPNWLYFMISKRLI